MNRDWNEVESDKDELDW